MGEFLTTERILESSLLRKMTNAKIMSRSTILRTKDENFKLDIAQIGNPETIGYVKEPILSMKPRPGEVEILVRAVMIESRDYRRAMGKTKKVQFGNACAGTIIRTGPDSGFGVGDRVFHIGRDTFRSRVRSQSEHVPRIPDAVDSTECCSSISALTAAHHALVRIGRWEEGETVLVYPCSGFISSLGNSA
jgi:NADPH:quinone reductase-like Zn-dependent oxidoreductase